MTREEFEADVSSMAPGRHNPAHAHDFDVKALVLDGEITLTCAGERRTYRVGDTFTMKAGLRHEEEVGATGITYLVGRRRA